MTKLVERAQSALIERARQNLLRTKLSNVSSSATSIKFENKTYINFSSNDYLGLATDFDIHDLAASQPSSGAMSSPLVIGNSAAHQRLEVQLRSFLNVPKTHGMLFFGSGYSANQAVLNTVFDGLLKDGLVLQDKLNHASLLESGKRLHLAKSVTQRRFKHNDLNDLANKIEANSLVVTEGVFSMDGDQAPLFAMSQLCKASQAMLMVDDAHGLGIETSSLHRAGLTFDDVDFYIGTFGKAIGAQGAVLIAKNELIDYFINFCKEYIYSTHLSPLQAEAIANNITKLQNEDSTPNRNERLSNNIKQFRQQAKSKGFALSGSETAIQPVIVGCERSAQQLAKSVQKEGIWLNAMRYPTVPKGQARLRVTLTSKHKVQEINRLVEVLYLCMNKADVPPKKVAAKFGQSVKTYKANAQLQYKSGALLLDALQSHVAHRKLDANECIGLDLGCGPGLYSNELGKLATKIVNLDLSTSMLASLNLNQPKICADSHQLPILSNSVDWIYSNLMIQWCDIKTVLSEIHRSLKPGGIAVVSTLLPDTLFELERAWKQVDHNQHIHQYQTGHVIEQAIEQDDWQDTNITDTDYTFWFTNVVALARELKGLGANYVSKRCQKGLTGKATWASLEKAYRSEFYDASRDAIPATYKLRTLILTKALSEHDKK